MATLAELTRLVGGELKGPADLEITGVGSLEGAGPADIAPVVTKRYLAAAKKSKAGALLVAPGLEGAIDAPCIAAPHPLVSLNTVIEELGLVAPLPDAGIHETAVVDGSAEIGEDVSIGAFAVVGPRARIGDRTVIGPGVVIESGVVLGERCVIEPGAILHVGAVLHNRVRVGANAVLSREGFGFAKGPHGPVRLHHIGRVVIEDDVHLGAGTMVDRARFDETRIGRSCGLDNLVHIGHNTTIGEGTFIAAQVGMAGMTRVGKGCEIGGQAGIANQPTIGDGARIGAQAGVIGPIRAGAEVWGTPARDKVEYLRQLALMRRIGGHRRS